MLSVYYCCRLNEKTGKLTKPSLPGNWLLKQCACSRSLKNTSEYSPPTESMGEVGSRHHLHSGPCRRSFPLSRGLVETVNQDCCHQHGYWYQLHYSDQCRQTLMSRQLPQPWLLTLVDQAIEVTHVTPPCCLLLLLRYWWQEVDSKACTEMPLVLICNIHNIYYNRFGYFCYSVNIKTYKQLTVSSVVWKLNLLHWYHTGTGA